MIPILYEDSAILVCCKPTNVLSQGDGSKMSMETLLQAQCGGQIFPVHRLDFQVGGVMVYAKTKQAAAQLGNQIQAGRLQKEYLAIVENLPPSQEIWEDLLWKDARAGKSYVVNRERKGVRKAKLQYQVLASTQFRERTVSLCEIHLFTGRSHQIRVQFSSRGYPLLGDGKYGGRYHTKLALFSRTLQFDHPLSGKPLRFSQPMPQTEPWLQFCDKERNNPH